MFQPIAKRLLPNQQAARLIRSGNRANAARQWGEAAAAYGKALKIVPKRAAIWVQYGHSLKEQGFLRDAEEAYLRAAALEDSADTLLQLGHVLKLQGEVERAISAYEAAIRLAPQITHGRAELATLRAGVRDLVITPNIHLRRPDRPVARKGRAPGYTGDPKFSADVHSAFLKPVLSPSSLDELLAECRLKGAFVSRFDPFYYFNSNDSVRGVLRVPSTAACLVHFCRSGIELGLPINSEDEFDPDFYIANHLHGLPFTRGNAYRHWLDLGVPAGVAPNRRRWLQSKLSGMMSGLDGVDVALFAAQTDAGAGGRPWTALMDEFLSSAGDASRPLPAGIANAGPLHAVAEHLDISGADHERAFRLRQIIAMAAPAYRPNQMQYAQKLLDRGVVVEAASIYRAQTQYEDAPAMAFLRLAESEEALGMLEDALRTSGRGRAAFPGDQFLRHRHYGLARRFFDRQWGLALAAGRLGRLSEGQDIVRHACLTIQAFDQPGMKCQGSTIANVAVVGHFPLPQCRMYRVDAKVEELKSAGYAVEVFDLGDGADAFLAVAHRFEAAIFFRVPALPHVMQAIAKATELGLVTIYEIDDLIFAPAYPGPLESYSGGITPEEHIGLSLAVPLFEEAMRLCQYGIASTASLARAMEAIVQTGTVFVHSNALGPRHTDFIKLQNGVPKRDTDDRITIFYGSGTKAHKEDFQSLVEPALTELVRRHGSRVAIVLMGHFPDSERLHAIRDNLTILEPTWDIEAYWSVLAEADINIAPLCPNPMTDAKSEIKWLEAGMLGIPSVVSDTATYRDVVRHGQTGLICAESQAWTAALDSLVRNPDLRQTIGQNAREVALTSYSPEAMANRMRLLLSGVSPEPDPRPLVVVVNVFYPPQAIGGATRVVSDNIRDVTALAGDRFRFEVFTSIDGGEPYEVRTYSEDGIKVTGVGTPHHQDLEYRAVDERMGEIFGAVLDRLQPAMVHFHCVQRLTASVVTAAAVRKIRYVISAHDAWWISDHQFLVDALGRRRPYDFASPVRTLRDEGPRAYGRLVQLRRALLGAARILAVSRPFADLYRSCGLANAIACENGVSDLTQTIRHPSSAGKVRLGFIGGLARHKGYDLVQIALRYGSFRNLSLLLIDHAMSPGDTRREIWGGVPVEFRAKFSQGRVSELYAQIDVLLAPSLWPESFGLVSREALAAGCWVIASDRGSIGQCIQLERNGFVVDVSSPGGLSAALERVDRDPERYRNPPEFRSELRRSIDQAAEMIVFYDEIIGTTLPPELAETVSAIDEQPVAHLGTAGSGRAVWRGGPLDDEVAG